MTTIVPIKNRIIVKHIKVDHKTASGIMLAVDDDATSNTARVEFIGPDVKNIQVGDTVIFMNRQLFKFLGQDYMTMVEDDILGIVK